MIRYIQNQLQRSGIRTIYKTISEDGGLTWGKPEGILTRKDVDPCEPGLIRSPDGTIIATTYGHWNEGKQPCILSVRFNMKETDDLVQMN